MTALMSALAVCSFIQGVFLLIVMNRRKLRAEFPLFFNYIALIILATAVFQVCSQWFWGQYFYAYWTFTAVSMILGFGVLHEVFRNILKPYSALTDFGNMMFKWAGGFLTITALTCGIAAAGTKVTQLCAGIHLFEQSVQLIQCGMLLLLLCFEKRLGLSWRSHGMCIALGLGTFAALDLVLTSTRGRFPALNTQMDMANSVITLGLFTFWTVGLMMPEAVRQTAQDSPTRIILQRWNDALGSTPLASGGDSSFSSIDSFIPGVEKAVERILAKQLVE